MKKRNHKHPSGSGRGSRQANAEIMAGLPPGAEPNFDDPLEGMFSNINNQSPGKAFTEPGDDPQKMLMRSYMAHVEPPDPHLVVRFLARCERFHDERHKQMLLNLMAASCSIDGRNQLLYLQAQVGMLSPELLNKMFRGLAVKAVGKDGKIEVIEKQKPPSNEES